LGFECGHPSLRTEGEAQSSERDCHGAPRFAMAGMAGIAISGTFVIASEARQFTSRMTCCGVSSLAATSGLDPHSGEAAHLLPVPVRNPDSTRVGRAGLSARQLAAPTIGIFARMPVRTARCAKRIDHASG
jgi:hypothetical protein